MGRAKLKDKGAVNASGVSYGELIRRARKASGMSQEELGALVSVGKNAVGAWESGRARPEIGGVPIICEALHLSLEDFFGMPVRLPDQGESDSGSDDDGSVRLAAEKFGRLSAPHREAILREMDLLLEIQRREASPGRKLLRLYRNDLAACAGPSFTIGDSMGEPVWLEETPITATADELIRVSGDSMEPEFHDGDLVLVQHGSSIRPGEIGIFTNGDAGYIKVYQRDGLYSLNAKYPVMRFHEGDEVRCIGKVLGIAEERMFATEEELRMEEE